MLEVGLQTPSRIQGSQTLRRARGTQNLNSSPLRCAEESVSVPIASTHMDATCPDIIFVTLSPFARQEVTDDFLIKTIMIDVIILPHRIARN